MVGKVLVVDDEDTLRLTIKTRLNAGGFETEAAVDGEDAIEKLKQAPFDVVLLDINMPRMDGITALEIISREYPATDVIMLTGFADFSTAIDCLKKGAKDYLVKPIDTTELITRMQSLLRARHSEAALDSLRKSHSSFLFDRVIDPAVKLHDALILLKKGELGKITKDQSALLSGMEEMAQAVVAAGVKGVDPAVLGGGGKRENQKNVALDKVLDGIPEFASALAKSKETDFVSNVKGKLPGIVCDELRLREALRSVAAAAIGIASKGTTVTLESGKDSGETFTFTVTLNKVGEKGKKLADQMNKPLEAIGGQLQKLDHESLLLYAAQRAFVEHGGSLVVKSVNSETVIECTVSKK